MRLRHHPRPDEVVHSREPPAADVAPVQQAELVIGVQPLTDVVGPAGEHLGAVAAARVDVRVVPEVAQHAGARDIAAVGPGPERLLHPSAEGGGHSRVGRMEQQLELAGLGQPLRALPVACSWHRVVDDLALEAPQIQRRGFARMGADDQSLIGERQAHGVIAPEVVQPDGEGPLAIVDAEPALAVLGRADGCARGPADLAVIPRGLHQRGRGAFERHRLVGAADDPTGCEGEGQHDGGLLDALLIGNAGEDPLVGHPEPRLAAERVDADRVRPEAPPPGIGVAPV